MRLLLLLISGLLYISGDAQSRYQFGMLPGLNINTQVSDNWKINLKIESRQLLRQGFFREDNDWDYQYVLTDIAAIAAKKVGLSSTLAGGYQLRIREGRILHRLIQQFATTDRYAGFRLSQRLAADQTMGRGQVAEWRLRYRLSSEFPLRGQSVNVQEFYLKINNEYLYARKGRDDDLEIRLVPMLGYEIGSHNKVELGLDYRLDSFINDSARSRFWIAVNWYTSI